MNFIDSSKYQNIIRKNCPRRLPGAIEKNKQESQAITHP